MCSPCAVTEVIWTIVLLCTAKPCYRHWNGTVESCPPNCGPAPDLDYGTKTIIDLVYINKSMTLEKEVSYTCKDDLLLIPPGQSHWNCLDGGRWSYSTLPRCLAQCKDPPALVGGVFSILATVHESMYLSGTIVEYTCNTGYLMYPQESNTFSCNSFGKWTGAIGSCYPVCSPAPEVDNALKSVTKQIAVNETLTLELEVQYSCNKNMILVPKSKKTWTCISSSWSHATPFQCLKDCGSAPDIDKGVKTVTNSLYVDDFLTLERDVIYSCNESFVFFPPNQSHWSCLKEGSWSHSTKPQCLPECPYIFNTLHASIVVRNEILPSKHPTGKYVYGTIIEHVCDDYYVKKESGNFAMSCQEDGTWNSTVIPYCQLEWSDTRKCNASYFFNVTNFKSNFHEVRKRCQELGGDLLYENLGFSQMGTTLKSSIDLPKYFETILDDTYNVFVGITDQLEEGVWRSVDDTHYDYTNSNVSLTFGWNEGEPNNVDIENCGETYDGISLNDVSCEKIKRGICEFKEITCV